MFLFLDDYRNPICAAINLAFHFGVKRLMLMCCDESYSQERPSCVKLHNNLYTYPQHIISQKIIDANLYWLTHQKDKPVEVVNFSHGIEYVNAQYINEEKALWHEENGIFQEGPFQAEP